MNDLQKKIGMMVFELRRKGGFTQVEYAEKIGIDQSQISRIENGQENLTLETLNQLAKALGRKVEVRFVK